MITFVLLCVGEPSALVVSARSAVASIDAVLTLENVRPMADRMDVRKADINKVIEPLAENYLRLNALGAYGSFFNIFYCSTRLKINGPAGSDILVPFGGPPDPSKGRCSEDG